ncbi:mannose-1-phosphate guanylyltransferase [Hyphobacterium sp.]|uniref:mannose-1-phosphate guanylyltransferase n=1 Tax=Hyphobacterium sp. TaxID=2004662 RepID=UPI003BAB9995
MIKVRPAILCGGSGERLWPLSRQSKPKPFHALLSERTIFEDTLLRCRGAGEGVSFADPLIVAGEAIETPVRRGLASAGIGAAAAVFEPVGRNTAPAAALAALLAQKADGSEALVLLVSSDHHIAPVEKFRETVAAAAPLATDGKIVVFGILPTRPETGYGYIRKGAPVGEGFAVAAFEEKPDAAKAAAYLEAGDRFWNAGIFLFRADTLLAELGRYEPEVLNAVQAALGADNRIDADAFALSPSIPLDIAVMERTKHAAVMPARFHWSDVGTWSSLADALDADAQGNVLSGDVIALETAGSYLRGEDVTVTAIGVENLVVVATRDAVFLAPRDRAHEVKRILAAAKDRKRDDLL